MGDAKRRKQFDPNFGQSDQLFSNLPPDTTAADYTKYLERNWDMLAAFAYSGYLNEGRGLLLLDWDLSLDQSANLLSPALKRQNDRRAETNELNCPVLYLGQRGSLLSPFLEDSPEAADWLRLIGEYDPLTMIVLALCWEFSPHRRGHIMARTLAMPHRLSPAALYVGHGDRVAEFGFWAGTDQAFPTYGNFIVRTFRVLAEHRTDFRQMLKACYCEGRQQQGAGAVVAIPSGEGFEFVFAPRADLAGALGADAQCRAFQQLLSIVDQCQSPDRVAVAVIDSDLKTVPEFMYYGMLLNIDKP